MSAAVFLGWIGVLSDAAPGQQSPETPRQQALREAAVAEAASRRAAQLRNHPDFPAAVSRDREMEAVLERAERVLRAAESGLARAEQTGSATGFSDSALLARRATRTFEQYEERLREIFRRIEIERSPPPPPPPPPPAAPPPGEPAEAVSEPAAPPPSTAPPPAPRRPPAKLRQAADAYFGGDYAAAVDLLSEIPYRQRKSRAHALLLRAAARYALFLLGGETDYAQRGQAAEDVAECKRADPDLAPDEGVFSPRFRDFFAATR